MRCNAARGVFRYFCAIYGKVFDRGFKRTALSLTVSLLGY